MYIYSMYAGNYIKIGITSNINSRIKQVQTGCPISIHKVIYKKALNRSEALKSEKNLHLLFSENNTFGEWFHRTIVDLHEYYSFFKDCKSITLGENQEDRSIEILKNMNNYFNIQDRDKKIKLLNGQRNHIVGTYDYFFISTSKRDVLKQIDKYLKKLVRNSSKTKINKVRNNKEVSFIYEKYGL